MIKSKEAEILHAQLDILFKKNKASLKNKEQLDILEKGFVYSQIDVDADILIMGINPSLRTDFLTIDSHSYDYSSTANDRYFKKFHQLFEDYPAINFTYCDLFYQRHSEQAQIEHFLKDDPGRTFLKEQLQITKSRILKLQPKCILLFNRRAASFLTTEWGLMDVQPSKIFAKAEIELVTLKGTEIQLYPSVFLGYRTPKSTLIKVKSDISIILNHFKNNLNAD